MQLLKDFYLSFINRTTEKLCLLIELLKELFITVEYETRPQGGYIRPKSSLVIKDIVNLLRLSLHPN